MEPKLTKQSGGILASLKQDVHDQLRTPAQFDFLRKAMLLQESMGIFGRFIISLAGAAAALAALISYWPFGGGK